MIRHTRGGFAAALALAACAASADTPYPIAEKTAAANLAAVRAKADGAYWKDAPFAVCAVEPLSHVKRLPDLLPPDGDFVGPVRVLAAKGEYEGGSFQVFAFEDLEGVQFAATDLVCGKERIPASAVDLTVVKVWYQGGNAWFGYSADMRRRLPVPELLLHDETLIDVRHDWQDNFVRCNYAPGLTEYRWISYTGADADHSYVSPDIRVEWVHDATELRPVSLQRHAFKQFMATVHVPENAAEGLYAGSIVAKKGGQTLCKIPFEVRVLPFELPLPRTFHDPERPFVPGCYVNGATASHHDGVAKNFAAHGVRNIYMRPCHGDTGDLRHQYDVFARNGMDTTRFFALGPPGSTMTSYPPRPDDKEYFAYRERVAAATNIVREIRKVVGETADIISFGGDELPPDKVLKERAIWQVYQSLGISMIATTHYHPYLFFCLDWANIPLQPWDGSKVNAVTLHEANPDIGLVWYADPHSGPENPAFARRGYGWTTWRNDYDGFFQYIVYRDNWVDTWVAMQRPLRGLMLTYPQGETVIDTLEWEGVREAVDDIRYGTLLRELAFKAKKSKDIQTVYIGRAALHWIAEVDFERSSLGYLRKETIRRILMLREALGKEAK